MKTKFYTLFLLAMFTLSAAAWSATVTLKTDAETGELYVNLPSTGLDILTIPDDVTEFKVYSDGGRSGYYSSNADGHLQLVAPEGSTLQLNGYVRTNNTNSQCFSVYDGTTEAPKLLDSLSTVSYGESRPINSLAGSSNIMTLYFGSDNSSGYKGPVLTVSVNPPEHSVSVASPVTGGSAQVDKAQVAFGEIITLTATPEEGYKLSGATFKDGNGNTIKVNVDVSWDSDVLTFAMPNSSVTVTPVFTQNYSAEGGLFVNMPKFGMKTIDIPAGVTSFKVYDDGGSNGYYSYNTKGYLKLIAPEGSLLYVSGTFSGSGYTYRGTLTIFDGDENASDKLLNAAYDRSVDVGLLKGSGREITFYFKNKYDDVYSGINMTVYVIVPKNISVESPVTGGSAQSDKTQAKYNELVTLNASPETGYLMVGASFKDEGGAALNVDVTPLWYMNEATFSMPNTDVRVTPIFTKSLTASSGLYVDMPATGMKTIDLPDGVVSFRVYDDGGSDGYYSSNADGYLKLVAPEGSTLRIEGWVGTHNLSNEDYLTIYDGDTDAQKLLDGFYSRTYGQNSEMETVVSSGNIVTLHFHSDGWNNDFMGLNLLVTHNPAKSITLSSVVGGSVSCNKAQATYGESITLTIAPETGYMLSGLQITDGSGTSVDLDLAWNSDVATFTMPNSDITITPTFTNQLTAEGGLFVKMPVTETKTVDIPEGVASFKVYDNGGSSSNYSNNSAGYLVLNAPEGYIMQVSGTVFQGDYRDFFEIHDGLTRNDPTLYSGSIPSSGTRNIGPVINSGRTLMFYFYSNASSNGEGLDLTVSLLDATIPYTVSLDEGVVGGTVSIEPSSAALGTLVKVTVNSAEGYALEDVLVTAENGKTVSVEGGHWTAGNVATFTMPYSNVTVSPVFTDDVNNLSVEVPKNGTEYVNVAPGITSFKVYDDGGSQGSYYSYSDGYLVLTAPEGYALQVSGTITTDVGGDYLSIYDGDSESAPELLSKKSSASLGKTTDIGVHTSSANVLMLYFHSDDQYQFAGLDLSVSVVPPQIVSITPVSGGSVSSIGTAFVNQTVTLTAVPDEGYVLDGYTAYSNGNVVNVNFKKWNNTATFVMPNDAVTITPVFSSVNDLFMNMPVSGTDTVVIPEGVKFIKVYDDGGSAANYSNNANGNLVLIAPEGRLLRINGSLTAEGTKTDNLTIYDGNNSAILLNSFAGSSNGIAADIGTIWSLSNEVKLSFKSDNTVNFAGLDLTVTVEDPSVSYDVSLNDAEGGSITVNYASASVGTSMILVATPEAGYVLSGVSVVDATGKEVEVTGGKWYSGDSAIFVMPASNVSITPVFSNALTADGGLFVNMPATGTRVVRIPQGVTSFMIYDDGGKDASYGNNVDGYLELIAPEKYGLDIVEEMQDIEGADYLKYDEGNGTWAGLYSFKTREKSLKLHFHTDASRNANGFEYLISPFLLDSVQIAQVEGGSVSCENLFPSPGSTVSLAITPNEGYYLKAISVVNSEGALVNVAGLSSFASAVTFVMPSSSVTVTPEFSNDLTAENGPFVNMPHSGTMTVQIPEGITAFKVYDDGGKDGVYLNNSNGYLELVAPEGCLLEVSGSMIAEIKRYDYLSIYDETSTFLSKDGAETSGSVFTVGPFTSNSRSLTIYFHSDNSTAYDGLSLDVAVVNLYGERTITMNSYTNGTVTGIPGTAILDETVSLTAMPDAGYVFNGVTVVDALGNNIADAGGTSWLDNTASFVMPASDVTVTPVFLTNATVEDGLYVNLPATGTRVVNVPDGVVSFKVYDDGGKDGDYSNNADGSIEFVAPEGFFLQLTGDFAIERNVDDFISVYDGDINAVNKDLRYYSGNLDFQSTGNKLTISFQSNESVVNSGLNLTVTLLRASILHDINIVEVTGGTISVEETSAAYGAQVVLTSHPNDGYVLTNVIVVDSDGSNVAVTGGTWLSENTASFVMPYKDVSVTPIFVKNPGEKDGLFINMPYKETRSVSIPEGVISFKVYDHAGKDANYWYNADDRLELTVPEGYVMYLMGTRSTEPNDVLVIYDGINTTAKLYEGAIAAAQHNSSSVICRSSANTMTLYFSSNASGQSDGLDFTVYVYSTTKEHSITVADGVTGGTASITPSSAVNGTPVSITTTPTSGYMLNQVVARDEFGLNAEINGNCTIDGACQLTLSMPGSNVEVTPQFSNAISSGEEPYFNLPAKGMISVNIPENTSLLKIYDDGGKDGAFSDDADGYIKLIAPAGHLMQVTGNLKTYGLVGKLSIYDGADAMSTRLVSDLWSNDRKDVGVLTTSNNVVLIRFNSGVRQNKRDDSGFDLTVKVFDASEEHSIALSDGVSGGTASFNLTNAAYKETITMTAIPDESYFLLNTTAVDEDGIEIPITGGKWYSEETAEFSMPNSDVTVTPEFSNDLTSLYINMPENGMITAYIPSNVTSFKVYDDGGAEGNYSYQSNGYLELVAPIGYVLQLSGTLVSAWSSCVDFSIYNGSVGSSTFLDKAGPEASGETLDIGPFTGDNQKMTIHFYSHCSNRYDGLDLTVNLVHVNENHHVTINNADYGSVISNPEDAAVGETITLTASPSDGFYLSEDIAVLGCNDETLVYTGGWYSNNQITFVMPNCNVSVTPTFIDVPYVKVPVAGMTTAYIPSNVTSFKVYDNGGANGDYSNNSDGYLKLIAPEGYVMHITGRNVADSPDHLAVCNGDATVAPFKTVDRNVDVLSTGNTTTLYFYSDAGGLRYSGFDLNVTLFNNVTHTVELAEGIVGGTVSIDKTSAVWGDTVTLTALSEDGYYLSGIDAIDENNDTLTVIDGWWFTSNVAKFAMPYANVLVTPHFVSGSMTDDAQYINMSWNVKKIANIPDGVYSFHVYDNGGIAGDYRANSNDTLMLVAPEGYVFEVSGSVSVPRYDADYLNIYEGDSDNLIRQVMSDFGPERSRGGIMKLVFSSNASGQADGLDLTISLVDESEVQTVAVSNEGAVNMPKWGTTIATISEDVASFRVYDDGGDEASYSNNAHGYLVLVAPEGKLLQITGSVNTYNYYDTLTVFDGDSVATRKLLNAAYGSIEEILKTSTGNVVTLHFASDRSGVSDGFEFEVDVIDPAVLHTVTLESADNGNIELVGENEYGYADTVILVASPDAGYLFKDVSVNAGGNNVEIIKENSLLEYGIVKIVMPNSDVIVTPVFTTSLTESDGIFVATPVAGRKNVVIPEGVTSFRIYDDGGPDKGCRSDATGILELTAPMGYAFQLTGSFNLSYDYACTGDYTCYNYLEINETGRSIYSKTPNSLQSIDIGTLTSNSNKITIEFHVNSRGAGGNLDVLAELVYVGIGYHVTFDVTPISNDVSYFIFGNGDLWKNENIERVMNSEENGAFPYLYRRTTDGNNQTRFDVYKWSPLLEEGGGNEATLASYTLTPAILAAAPANEANSLDITLYPSLEGNIVDYPALDIPVIAYNGSSQLTSESDYHGNVVLSQTWGGKTYTQASTLRYDSDADIDYQGLEIPSPDYADTLVFDVSTDDGIGYATVIDDFVYSWQGQTVEEGWGYNADAKTLKIAPDLMLNMEFKIHYEMLSYNVSFDIPNPESGVFVANKMTNNIVSMDWFGEGNDLTIENAAAPTVYNANGCRVAWKVKGRRVDARDGVKLGDELQYMVSTIYDASAVNELELDLEHPVCPNVDNGTGPTYLQTLQVDEGNGKLVLIQKIGETVISHDFVDNQMSVPEHFDTGTNEETGVTLTVVAVPDPGYVLKQLTYDMIIDGNNITALVQDSASVNVKQNLTWHVKFSNYEPVYVAYDLSLGAEDSSNVWLPANAAWDEALAIPYDGSATEMWKPFREDLCFAGWTKDLNDADAPVYTGVDFETAGEFSKNGAEPTILYALWKPYGGDCSYPSAYTYIYPRYYEDIQDPSNYVDAFSDTLIVMQKLGDIVFMHKGLSLQVANNPYGYKMLFGILPEYGHELDTSAHLPQVAKLYSNTLSLLEGDDEGVFILGSNETNDEECYVGYKDVTTYKVVLSSNAGDATVFYGDYWTSSAAIRAGGNLPDGSIFRTDACFSGWSFDPDEVADYSFDRNNRLGTFGLSLLQQRVDRRAMGLNVDTLYAKWNAANLNCISGSVMLELAVDFNKNASVSLYQKVDGTDVKVLEIGSEGVIVPFGTSVYHNGSYYDDHIDFSKAVVTPKSGAALSDNYQLSYVDPYDVDETEYEITEQPFSFTSDAEFRLQGLTRNTYNVVYHENADDANVFYGENWSAEVSLTTDDDLSFSLYRADKCLTGWSFEGEQTKYSIADAEFVAAYEARVAAGASTDLYAVWSNDAQACGTIETVMISLSTELQNISTAELVQTVGGEAKVVATVGEEGLSIPTAGSDENIYFSSVNVVPFTGYEIGEGTNPSYKVGNEEAVEVTTTTPAWTMTDATVISGSVVPTGYSVAFDVNAGKANVFYSEDWISEAAYDIAADEDMAFPKAYRTDKCLVGYGFDKDASRDQSFLKFDTNFVKAYNVAIADGGDAPVTVYAVWNECSQELYTVTLNDVAEGTLVLTQNGKAYDVPSAGFVVPGAVSGIEFGVAFTPNLGYKLDETGTFNVVDETGAILQVLTENTLVVNSDKIVDAPVVTLENTFAFDVNADNAVLFYGNDWVKSAMFSLDAANTDFPAGLYRVGRCLKGWALNIDAERSYKKFDEEFLADVEATKNAGLPVNKLYAVWDACEEVQTLASVENDNVDAGSFTLTRTVSGTTVTYALAGEALMVPVPADAPLTFSVAYAPNNGYAYDEESGLSSVVGEETTPLIDNMVTVSGDMKLAAAVTATAYQFAIDVNAGDANVFYAGTPVTSVALQVTGDAESKTLPTNIYRSEACLNGFAFTNNAVSGFKKFDEDFIDAYDSAVTAGNAPQTLYAVWDRYCLQTLYNVTSDDLGKGELKLRQGENAFTVGSAGLQVPAVNGGLTFTVEFTPKPGYTYNELQGLEATNADGSYETIEDNLLTVTRTVAVKAASLVASGYEVVFNMNAGDATVFYGNEWRAVPVQTLYSFTQPSELPKDLYRTDSCFVGWTVVQDNANVPALTAFGNEFIEAADGNTNLTLFAKWGACDVANNATVAQVTANAGKLILSQTDAAGDTLVRVEVEGEAVTLPKGNDDVSFGISFEVAEGYVLDPDGYFYTVSSNGNNLVALVEGKLALSSNTRLRAPVVSDTYAVTFDVNAANAGVFYGGDWIENKVYSIGEEAIPFPKGLYRTDKCFMGWGLNADAETSYKQFDIAFMTEVETAKKAGLPTSILYAVWSDCETEQVLASVTHNNGETGSFTLTRKVSETTVEYTVAGEALVVPVPENETLTFEVAFTANSGYAYDAAEGITATDASGATASVDPAGFAVSGDVVLEAAVTPTEYEFAIDMNAGSADLFYAGEPVTSVRMRVTDNAATKTLPTNVYRRDACLDGFAFTDDATIGYKQLDASFIAAYDAITGTKPETLYAVWNTRCDQKLLTVTFVDSTKGSLVLSQGNRQFNVGSGFTVPAVTGGLEFVAAFTADVGYTYDPLLGVELYDASNVLAGTSDENGVINLAENVSVKAAGIVANEYSISYLENAGDATVFYGDSWRAGNFQSEFTRENTGDLPMDLYRTDSCLLGWTLSQEANATVFKKFNRDLLLEGDGGVGVLYAKWGSCLTANNATVSQVSSAAGTIVLTQTDAEGGMLSEVRVGSSAVTLPTGNGDVSFNVSFEVGEGYSLVQNGYYYTVDARGNNLAALANDKLTLAGNTVLRAPILSDTYVITFNTNAGDANVFYGSGWVSEGQFSMDMDAAARTYPTEVYRVGYTLVGWSLEPMAAGATLVANADGGYEGVYNLYDEDFSAVVKAAGNESVTLYAVWGAASAQQTYHVTLADAAAGYITAQQTVGTTKASFVVGAEGLEVPAVTGGLTFSLEATLNPGYFEDGHSLYLVNSDLSRIDSIAGAVLVVNSDKIIEIPVQTDGVQFVFSVNTDARVFYEDGWESTGYFALNGDTAFPTGVLRTEGRLLGWALSRTSTKYYTAYNGKFVEDLNNYKSLGLPTSTLYAVWSEYGVFENVNVKNNSGKNGSFFISQVVDGVETDPIEVNAAGIQIPYSEKGISFNVKFETKAGYYINAEQAISSVDVQQGTTLGQAENGGQLVFKSTHDVALNASVDANRFKFTYNVNGGDANVFYAASWVGNGDKSLNDTSLVFPTNIYRSDACLEGWSMDSTAETGSTLLTSEFIETLDRTQNVNTLYAVWKECEVPTYKVSFANTNVGSLVLSQDLGDTVVTFNVGEEGLDVPVVAEALKFRAAYTLKPGYSGNTDSLYVVDDLNGLLTTLADNSLTVDEDITLAIPTQGQAFKLVFDVNRKGKLFYGADWIESGIFELSDKRNSIPLPAYVYTSDACMVGWSLSKSDTVMYQKFASDLISALQDLKSKDSTYTMYAVWGKGSDCDRAYDRISLKSKNGTVTLAEAPRGEEKEYIVHEFMDDGTMIVPRTMNGNNIRVFSVADSSYMLDSLVMTREGSEDERQVFYEGDALVFNLDGVKFEAFFGKSNRTAVAFVNPKLVKSGNAVRFAFTTSMFEITRKVSASVILETADGKTVASETFVDSIVPPYDGAWDKFPLAAGRYVLKATIGDERETDYFEDEFEVVAEIAAVSEESWQMISIGNLDKDAMVWDDDAKFFWWDETSASGDYWQYKEYNPKDEIVPTRGYWYNSLEGRSLVLKNDVEEKIADKVEWKLDSVNSGWNLVANPYGFALNLYADHEAEYLEALEEAGVTFWRWDVDSADYVQAFVAKPYEAVWVKVDASTDWVVPVAPEFVTAEDSLEDAVPAENSLNKALRLVKANSTSDWRIQAVLSDSRGHKDATNVLGASNRPFAAEEPPEGMGDHVKLSVVDGDRRLAKSVKAPADEQEWTISLSANTERYGDLTFKGVDDLNALGLKVFVTVDGKTTEMREGEGLKVALRASATKATVRVAKNAKVVADLRIDGLRSVRAGSYLNVSFEASEDLAGTRTVVDVLNMDGKVVSSRSATTLSGTNALSLDAPRGGMYMLRVRAGSQMKASRIIVR